MVQGVALGAGGASGSSGRAVDTCRAGSSARTVVFTAILWAGLQLSGPSRANTLIALGFIQGIFQRCNVISTAKLVADEGGDFSGLGHHGSSGRMSGLRETGEAPRHLERVSSEVSRTSASAGLLGVSVVEEERGRPACSRASWVLRRWIWGLPFWGGSPPLPPTLLRRLCRLVPRFIGGAPRICCRTRLRAAGGAEVAGLSESKGRAEEAGASPTSDPTSVGSEGGAPVQAKTESCGETEERRRCGWKNCFRPWPNAPMFSRALWVILDKPCSDSDALLPTSSSARPPVSGSSGLCSLLPCSIRDLQFHKTLKRII
ncbi:hypothetical protein EYF80_004163 [Liparis tanakae]|uniref:Uncharacterized protein n=1 Tax=Liparis tanakae TaxID=230148 RepID=A0A4Z2J5T4_9TELE|nr:hypothetical protein EYF80_004163 [Liparis tanakae]